EVASSGLMPGSCALGSRCLHQLATNPSRRGPSTSKECHQGAMGFPAVLAHVLTVVDDIARSPRFLQNRLCLGTHFSAFSIWITTRRGARRVSRPNETQDQAPLAGLRSAGLSTLI